MDIIKVKNLSVKYGKFKALKNISLEIKRGEIFGLIGPSGSGKSTFLNSLSGLINSFEGEIQILDESVLELSVATKKKIGIQSSFSGLYEDITVFQNLMMFGEIYGVKKEKILNLMDSASLLPYKNKKIGSLSTGMKKRVTFLKSIINSPEVLFLDEPTSSLDPITAKTIEKIIQDLKNKGSTIILATHNMSAVSFICDRIGMLNEGSLIEVGTPNEICIKHMEQKEYTVTLQKNEQLIFRQNQSDLLNLCNLIKENKILTIHSNEPNLESVFVKLVKKKERLNEI